MKRKTRQYLLYILFAFISTFINLVTQLIVEYFFLLSYQPYYNKIVYQTITLGLIFKICIATFISFLFKFFVDKLVIFNDNTKEIIKNLKKITIYAFFAIFTTAIFWGFELLFKLLFDFRYSEYLGGFIGLIFGYTLKFILDTRYVFNKK